MIKIPMADHNSFNIQATLDDETYALQFDWNEAAQIWTMRIDDTLCVVLVPNTPLLKNYRYLDLPAGEFVADARSGAQHIGRQDFVSGKANMFYVTGAELGQI